MIFSIVIVVLAGAIAYFHYVQGFFSATLSAILAVVSAVVAFSYHEVVVRSLLRGKMADQAHALVLVGLFVLSYSLLRFIFDMAIPGNVRMPVIVDKVGAGVMGIVAGIFSIGILAIAAQTLPFGPSIAGYARYALVDSQPVQLPTQRQQMDAYIYDALKSDEINPQEQGGLFIPVDDIVVNLTSHLSDGGSLSGPQALDAVHPSYLDELFFQRLGVQTGAKHVAYNIDTDQQVAVRGLYTIDVIPQGEGEIKEIRAPRNLPLLKSDPSRINLIVRLFLSRSATDGDNKVRISPVGVRLVANATNYFPIGTLDLKEAPVVRVNRPDDYLIAPGDAEIDFVFQIPREELGLQSGAKARGGPLSVGQGVFIEAKRLGYVDLSGKPIEPKVPAAPAVTLMRKENLPPPKTGAGAAASPAAVASNVPFVVEKVDATPRLFTEINVGPHESDAGNLTFASGTASIREMKFSKLDVDPTQTIALLSRGDNPVSELWAPPGQKLVQLTGAPPSRAADGWEWAGALGQFELIDDKGGAYKPHGAWAKVKQGTSDRMVARYNAEAAVADLPQSEGRPTAGWIAFIVPENTTIKEVRFNGKRIKSLNLEVK